MMVKNRNKKYACYFAPPTLTLGEVGKVYDNGFMVMGDVFVQMTEQSNFYVHWTY